MVLAEGHRVVCVYLVWPWVARRVGSSMCCVIHVGSKGAGIWDVLVPCI